MHLKRNIFFLFQLLGLFSIGQQAQFASLDDLAGKLIRSLRSDAGENIFIHTDKSVYKAGENIWFNAYLVNKTSHKISHQSKIVFVDLVNEKDSVINQWVLDARSLSLDGSMQLPVVLQDGNYWLRGYTSNILKTDSNDICVHPIYIVNPQNVPAVEVTSKQESQGSISLMSDPIFEIYPEGGSFIAGVTSVVGFRVTDLENHPLEVSGYIKDNRDSITTRFTTSLPGMGKFSLFPWKTRQYTAYIKTNDGQEYSYLLPATDNYAACLSVISENENSIRVRVSLGDSLYDKKTVTYLLGISRDSLCFAGVGERMYETDIPKKNFPQGDATLALFDQHDQLLSERNIYIERTSTIVDIKPDKENYSARQNAVLNFSVTDDDQRPVLSLLSVAVTDDNSVKYFYDDDIEAVTKRSYTAEERDLVMLVQKDTYKKWKLGDSVRNVATSGFDERFFKTSGVVLDKKSMPVPNIIVTLFSAKNQGIFRTDTTDVKGHFNFNLPGYADSTQFMLQATDKRGKVADVKILLDSSVAMPKFRTPSYLKKVLPLPSREEILQRKAESTDFLLQAKGKELKEVIVRSRIKKQVNYDEKKRVSQFSKVITSDMIAEGGPGVISNSLFMIPGAHMNNGKLIIDPGGDAEPLVVMDGVELGPGGNSMEGIRAQSGKDTVLQPGIDTPSPLISFLNSLSPRYIDFIEVLTGPEAGYYGVRGGNGVILIHTLTTMREGYVWNKHPLKRFYPQGFTNSTPFYEPDYDKKEVQKGDIPDKRSTIYWSGPVVTDNNGKATLNFFTADPGTTYTVTVEGITVSGDIFLKRFLVKRK